MFFFSSHQAQLDALTLNPDDALTLHKKEILCNTTEPIYLVITSCSHDCIIIIHTTSLCNKQLLSCFMRSALVSRWLHGYIEEL